jgi:hypothetical protein
MEHDPTWAVDQKQAAEMAFEVMQEAKTWETAWQDLLLLKTRRTPEQRAKYKYELILVECHKLLLTDRFKNVVWESPTFKADEHGNSLPKRV